MSDLINLIEEVITNKDAVNELENQIQACKTKEEGVWNSIVEGILSGGTFGDPISDFVIVRHGKQYPKITKKFNDINQKFAGKVGQFFMVVHSKRVRYKFSGNGEGDFTNREEHIIGVATSESLEFDLQKRNFLFPSENKCATLSPEYNGGLQLHQKNAAEMLEKHPDGHEADEELFVVVGDNGVVEYIRGKKLISQLCKSSIFLGKSLDKSPYLWSHLRSMQEDKIKELYLFLTQYAHLKAKWIHSEKPMSEDDQNLAKVAIDNVNAIVGELESLGVDVRLKLLPLLVEKISLECESTLLGAALGLGSLEYAECRKKLLTVNEKLPLNPKTKKA